MLNDDIKNNKIFNKSKYLNDFPSIQEAIDAADEGDTIYVSNGTYKECIIINKSINLIGENKENTIIDGDYQSDTVVILTENINVSGFTVKNSLNNLFSAGIKIYAHYVTILDCIVENNDCGIRVETTDNITISQCIIRENDAHSIFNIHSSDILIDDCEICHNGRQNYLGGIRVRSYLSIGTPSNLFIQNCHIYENKHIGIAVGNGGESGLAYRNVVIRNNTLYNHDGEELMLWNSEFIIEHNIFDGYNRPSRGIMLSGINGHVTIQYNIFRNYNKYAIYLLRSEDNSIRQNNFINNINPIYFEFYGGFFPSNNIENNYYDDLTIPFCKILKGMIFSNPPIFRFNFYDVDWHPAVEPFNLPSF